jgi:hypothetical protein
VNDQEVLAATLMAEVLVPVNSLPAILPAAPSGKPLCRSAVWRWVSNGLPGPDEKRVRLEAVRLGRRWMTSRQALARFMAATSRRAGAERHASAPKPARATLLPQSVAVLAARGFDPSEFGGGP